MNLHLDGTSCHKQHHDIYSIAQRESAGRDCTCSFKSNVATACFSLGSSRRVLLKAQRGGVTFEGSGKVKNRCGAECTGHAKKPWLNSGDLMYFNDKWNRAWTHGIPKHDAEADDDGEMPGPRISIALLCAEADPGGATCSLEVMRLLKRQGGLALPGAAEEGAEALARED